LRAVIITRRPFIHPKDAFFQPKDVHQEETHVK
jgi:hypothetical protein